MHLLFKKVIFKHEFRRSKRKKDYNSTVTSVYPNAPGM